MEDSLSDVDLLDSDATPPENNDLEFGSDSKGEDDDCDSESGGMEMRYREEAKEADAPAACMASPCCKTGENL